MIIILPVVSLLFAYSILIGAITVGWYRTNENKKKYPNCSTKVSIVVAARNEAQNIGVLLNDLGKQEYPAGLLEIIVVDDQSEDDTSKVAEEFSNKPGIPVTVFEMHEAGGSGKKAALDFGIRQAKGELILCTDADCRVPLNWVRTIAGYFEEYRPVMILAPVRFEEGFGFFGMMQELEFMSLLATTAGSARCGFPLMANGANLAYSKEAYLSAGGFADNMKYPSGDDLFMMTSFKKRYGRGSVRFLKSGEVVVKTPPEKRLSGFINQRLRWVSKSRGYRDIPLMISSILVYLTNLIFFLVLVQGIFHADKLYLAIMCYLFKLMIDLPVMIGISRFQGRLKLIWLFPLLEVINAIYISIIGFIGNRKSFTWKGRRFTP